MTLFVTNGPFILPFVGIFLIIPIFLTMKNFYGNNKCYGNVKELDNENKIGISAEALECKICFDLFDRIPGLLKCGHSFCYKCINIIRGQATLKKSNTFQCPLCTKNLQISDLIIPNYAFDEVLQYASKTIQDMPQYNNDNRLQKTLETQKHLYAAACKIIENLEKEKMPQKIERETLIKELQRKDDIVMLIGIVTLVFFVLFFVVLNLSNESVKRSRY